MTERSPHDPVPELSSPACSMHEVDNSYMGYAGKEELVTFLNELLEAGRAGARVTGEIAHAADNAALTVAGVAATGWSSLLWHQQEIEQGRLLAVSGGQRRCRPAGDQHAPAARDGFGLAGEDLGKSGQLVEDAVRARREADLLARRYRHAHRPEIEGCVVEGGQLGPSHHGPRDRRCRWRSSSEGGDG